MGSSTGPKMEELDLQCIRAFVIAAECGSVTNASHRLGRTQPAISLQLRRLERALGKPLFRRNGRRLAMTDEGRSFLSPAKNVLNVLEDARSSFGQTQVNGTVILGIPDLYAACFLPRILNEFAAAYPKITIELRCDVSTRLLRNLDRGEIDLAVVTRMPGVQGGELTCREQLVWATGAGHRPHLESPIPIAMLPPGNLYRDLALKALEKQRRSYRIAAISESFSGLQAALFAGLAVSVIGRSSMLPGLKELGSADGLPTLPSVDIVVHQRKHDDSKAANSLAAYLKDRLSAHTPRSPRSRKLKISPLSAVGKGMSFHIPA